MATARRQEGCAAGHARAIGAPAERSSAIEENEARRARRGDAPVACMDGARLSEAVAFRDDVSQLATLFLIWSQSAHLQFRAPEVSFLSPGVT